MGPGGAGAGEALPDAEMEQKMAQIAAGCPQTAPAGEEDDDDEQPLFFKKRKRLSDLLGGKPPAQSEGRGEGSRRSAREGQEPSDADEELGAADEPPAVLASQPTSAASHPAADSAQAATCHVGAGAAEGAAADVPGEAPPQGGPHANKAKGIEDEAEPATQAGAPGADLAEDGAPTAGSALERGQPQKMKKQKTGIDGAALLQAEEAQLLGLIRRPRRAAQEARRRFEALRDAEDVDDSEPAVEQSAKAPAEGDTPSKKKRADGAGKGKGPERKGKGNSTPPIKSEENCVADAEALPSQEGEMGDSPTVQKSRASPMQEGGRGDKRGKRGGRAGGVGGRRPRGRRLSGTSPMETEEEDEGGSSERTELEDEDEDDKSAQRRKWSGSMGKAQAAKGPVARSVKVTGNHRFVQTQEALKKKAPEKHLVWLPTDEYSALIAAERAAEAAEVESWKTQKVASVQGTNNMCHQCQRSDKVRGVVRCKNVTQHRFCVDCIELWYPAHTEAQIVEQCPKCTGNCNCKACLRTWPTIPYRGCAAEERVQLGARQLRQILVHLERINAQQQAVLAFERERDPQFQLRRVELHPSERMNCSHCRRAVFDFLYSCVCEACEFDICIHCARDLQRGQALPPGFVKGVGSFVTDAEILQSLGDFDEEDLGEAGCDWRHLGDDGVEGGEGGGTRGKRKGRKVRKGRGNKEGSGGEQNVPAADEESGGPMSKVAGSTDEKCRVKSIQGPQTVPFPDCVKAEPSSDSAAEETRRGDTAVKAELGNVGHPESAHALANGPAGTPARQTGAQDVASSLLPADATERDEHILGVGGDSDESPEQAVEGIGALEGERVVCAAVGGGDAGGREGSTAAGCGGDEGKEGDTAGHFGMAGATERNRGTGAEGVPADKSHDEAKPEHAATEEGSPAGQQENTAQGKEDIPEEERSTAGLARDMGDGDRDSVENSAASAEERSVVGVQSGHPGVHNGAGAEKAAPEAIVAGQTCAGDEEPCAAAPAAAPWAINPDGSIPCPSGRCCCVGTCGEAALRERMAEHKADLEQERARLATARDARRRERLRERAQRGKGQQEEWQPKLKGKRACAAKDQRVLYLEEEESEEEEDPAARFRVEEECRCPCAQGMPHRVPPNEDSATQSKHTLVLSSLHGECFLQDLIADVKSTLERVEAQEKEEHMHAAVEPGRKGKRASPGDFAGKGRRGKRQAAAKTPRQKGSGKSAEGPRALDDDAQASPCTLATDVSSPTTPPRAAPVPGRQANGGTPGSQAEGETPGRMSSLAVMAPGGSSPDSSAEKRRRTSFSAMLLENGVIAKGGIATTSSPIGNSGGPVGACSSLQAPAADTGNKAGDATVQTAARPAQDEPALDAAALCKGASGGGSLGMANTAQPAVSAPRDGAVPVKAPLAAPSIAEALTGNPRLQSEMRQVTNERGCCPVCKPRIMQHQAALEEILQLEQTLHGTDWGLQAEQRDALEAQIAEKQSALLEATRNNDFLLAASRRGSRDNFMVCMSQRKIVQTPGMDRVFLHHFMQHWERGEPMIFRDTLSDTKEDGLSWEPLVMWRGFRETTKGAQLQEKKEVMSIDCADWLEVEVNMHVFFEGYSRGCLEVVGGKKLMLKLKDWPPTSDFSDRLARHGAEFERALPLHPYMHPKQGELNLFAAIPPKHMKPDLGPKTYIAYGRALQLGIGDSCTKLHCDMADAVNILTHSAPSKEDWARQLQRQLAAEEKEDAMAAASLRSKRTRLAQLAVSESGSAALSTAQIAALQARLEREEAALELRADVRADVRAALEALDRHSRWHWFIARDGAAHWDIFRREDVPKLRAFLRRHQAEFRHLRGKSLAGQMRHEIHDQKVFLTDAMKERLFQEEGVEAWSFEQKVGDAVLVPAGCPHQVRNIHSCIKVALDFVSGENLGEVFKLVDEFRTLPPGHRAKEDKLGVGSMLIHSAKKVLDFLKKELGPENDMQRAKGAVNGSRLSSAARRRQRR